LLPHAAKRADSTSFELIDPVAPTSSSNSRSNAILWAFTVNGANALNSSAQAMAVA